MKKLFFTVDLEEWFHSRWYNSNYIVSKYFSGKFPNSYIRITTDRLLDLFETYDIRGTFFILVSDVKRQPGLVEDINSRGHEIAVHGFEHLSILDLEPEEFEKQIRKAKKYLERQTKERVCGYRAPHFRIDSYGIKAIERCNFRYDSSINPCIRIPGWYGNPTAPLHPYMISRSIIEFPNSVFPGLRLPGAGGWYLRNFGTQWVKLLLRSLLRRQDTAIFYLHPWELSKLNPNIRDIPFHFFRNTGIYVSKAIESIAKTFKYCDLSKTLRDYLEDI